MRPSGLGAHPSIVLPAGRSRFASLARHLVDGHRSSGPRRRRSGGSHGQKDVLATIDDANLRIYVVWAPKNGGRQQDVGKVTQLVTDPRAAQYWDGHRVLTDAYDRMFTLSGPCAGIFMLYGRQARWESAEPPRPDYLEDAHAREFNRPNPQYDPRRFAAKVQEMLTRTK